MLKVSPWKGVVRFGKRGKLNPKYVGTFKVLEKVREDAYKLELTEELSRVHNTFHVSNLKKCYADEPLAVPLDGLHFDDKLQFVEEPVEIMDREVKWWSIGSLKGLVGNGTVVDGSNPNKRSNAGSVLLFNEGFHNTRIVYLGGLWVMIELNSSKSKLKFMEHVGVASWFRSLGNAQSEIVAAKERLELFVWSPSFKEVPEQELCSDDESIKANEQANNLNLGDENDSEVVSDTYFGDNGEDQGVEHHHDPPSNIGIEKFRHHVRSIGLSFEIMEDTVPADVYSSPVGSKPIHCLGSKAKKEWIRELNYKHKVSFLTLQETKMENISAMEAKILWGNSSFDHVFSEALGNSGGILCLWDPLMFRKDQHIISDNFVVLYGTWVPNNTKLLIVFVYGTISSATDKRLLWSYITGLLSRWNGEDFLEFICSEDSNCMGPVGIGDHNLDQGGVSDEILLSRMELTKQMQDIKSTAVRDQMQKAKIQWLMFISSMASVLLMEVPTQIIQFHCGLNKGILWPFLSSFLVNGIAPFVGFSRTVEAGVLFKSRRHCFLVGSGLKINLQKSNLLEVGVHRWQFSLTEAVAILLVVSSNKARFQILMGYGWRLYALDNNKECSVVVKMQGEIDSSFRRHVRGGVETQQLENIQDLVEVEAVLMISFNDWNLTLILLTKMLVEDGVRFYEETRDNVPTAYGGGKAK
ncbi:RNA-directed DNA polymerase, eukaryota [Tanacetum coccineum]